MRGQPAKNARHGQFHPYIRQMVGHLEQPQQKCRKQRQNDRQPHEPEGFPHSSKYRVVNSLGQIPCRLDAIANANAKQPAAANGDLSVRNVVIRVGNVRTRGRVTNKKRDHTFDTVRCDADHEDT